MDKITDDDLTGDKPEDEIIIDDAVGAGASSESDGGEPESLDGLKAQLAEIRKNAEATQRQLDEERSAHAREKQAATAELTDTRLQTISNAIDATAGDIKQAQAKYRAAREAGDYDAEIAANDELMALKVKQSRLHEGKTAIEQQIEESKRAPADPVEAYASTLAPEAQRWIRAHPEVVTDPRKNARLTAAHYEAMAEGIAPNSADYFSHIEERMGYAAPQRQEEQRRDNAPVERRQSAPAAPVSRDVPNGNGQQRSTRVTLTAAEREHADMAGMSYADYAKERERLKAEGAFMVRH